VAQAGARWWVHRDAKLDAPMTLSPMPLRIETERLVLTPEEPSDAEWLAELLNARGIATFTVADALDRSTR
jgi:hypothetical protein